MSWARVASPAAGAVGAEIRCPAHTTRPRGPVLSSRQRFLFACDADCGRNSGGGRGSGTTTRVVPGAAATGAVHGRSAAGWVGGCVMCWWGSAGWIGLGALDYLAVYHFFFLNHQYFILYFFYFPQWFSLFSLSVPHYNHKISFSISFHHLLPFSLTLTRTHSKERRLAHRPLNLA